MAKLQTLKNDNDKDKKYLTPTGLLYYLSMTFENGDYHKYIQWLHDKINYEYSLKQCLIHYNSESTIFSDFTTQLFKNKNMIGEFRQYNQKMCSEGFYHKIVINKSLYTSDLYNILLVYQLDKIPIREMYKDFEVKDNIIDYECNCKINIDFDELDKYIKHIKVFNRHNPLMIIKHKNVKFDKELNDLEGYYSGGAILIGYEEDKPVACVAVRKINDEACEGKRLFIKPEYRGKGYARIMIKAMTDKASELGFKEVVFTTKPAVMSVGYGLYKRMGFEELSEENGIVSMRIDLRK